jgi:hypothetical protein
MGWDIHRGGRKYYTRSRRVQGRVVRRYVGAGDVGELAAAADACRRAQRQAQASELKAERARWQAAEQLLRELDAGVDLLAQAALLAAGFRQHDRGEWRRTRHGIDDEGRNTPEVGGSWSPGPAGLGSREAEGAPGD